jgi:hypothetical protein
MALLADQRFDISPLCGMMILDEWWRFLTEASIPNPFQAKEKVA